MRSRASLGERMTQRCTVAIDEVDEVDRGRLPLDVRLGPEGDESGPFDAGDRGDHPTFVVAGRVVRLRVDERVEQVEHDRTATHGSAPTRGPSRSASAAPTAPPVLDSTRSPIVSP